MSTIPKTTGQILSCGPAYCSKDTIISLARTLSKELAIPTQNFVTIEPHSLLTGSKVQVVAHRGIFADQNTSLLISSQMYAELVTKLMDSAFREEYDSNVPLVIQEWIEELVRKHGRSSIVCIDMRSSEIYLRLSSLNSSTNTTPRTETGNGT